jgi:hypothetical protein
MQQFQIQKCCRSSTLVCPHPQPLSQAWERGAGTAGSGGVRARDFADTRGFSRYMRNKIDLENTLLEIELLRSSYSQSTGADSHSVRDSLAWSQF